MKLRKVLFVVLGIIFIGVLITGVVLLVQRQKEKKNASAMRNINVAALSGASEKAIATIYYPGGKVLSDAKQEGTTQKAVFETTDSVEGAVNIYYQDLLNRYKTYDVSKKTITKSDALNKKAAVITCSGKSGKITITVWGKTNGMTQVEVVTSSDFK